MVDQSFLIIVLSFVSQSKGQVGRSGGKHDRIPDHNHLSCVCWMVQALRPDSHGQSGHEGRMVHGQPEEVATSDHNVLK
jgi:hypothetical protein